MLKYRKPHTEENIIAVNDIGFVHVSEVSSKLHKNFEGTYIVTAYQHGNKIILQHIYNNTSNTVHKDHVKRVSRALYDEQAADQEVAPPPPPTPPQASTIPQTQYRHKYL